MKTVTFDENMYVLVPKEPTPEMLLASYHPKVNSDERAEIYSAMIAATPQVPMEGLPVRWLGADGANHEISIDYAAQIAQWMFDTYGDVAQVDAVLATPQPQPAEAPRMLTDEQIQRLAYQHLPTWDHDHITFARAVESAVNAGRTIPADAQEVAK